MSPRKCSFCLALLLLLSFAAIASARYLHNDATVTVERSFGRELQQSSTCSAVHKACSTCRNQRIPGTRKTTTVCSACATGWRLRNDKKFKTCDCNSGFGMDASGWCTTCPSGMFCPGWDPKVNPNNAALACPSGLATKYAGAKSVQQCFTLPGYGRTSSQGSNGQVAYKGVPCPAGSYSVGGTTGGCTSCMPGLTTAGTSTNSSAGCLAPAGSYYARGIGRQCPKGTYTSGLNTQPACTPCNPGVTTEGEGATSPLACNRAVVGYFFVAADLTAAPCPLHTYKEVESAAQSCTPCPHGWMTRQTGSDGLAACLAPPGSELRPDATDITPCEVGWYKADWNRNPCVACGINLDTAETGSQSKEACRVPPGFGLVSMFPLTARQCTQNSYGDSVARLAMASTRCQSCPPRMVTPDVFTGVDATAGYTAETDCVVPAGYGLTETGHVEECLKGFFNPGGNRLPCGSCPAGYTTLGGGSKTQDACVVQPGWALDTTRDPPLAKPCDKGTFSVGGTAVNPNGVCQACPAGFTTQEEASVADGDCSLCLPGRGGAGCGACPYNSYSSAPLAAGQECPSCPAGFVSARGASTDSSCFESAASPNRDTFELSPESAWSDFGDFSAASPATAQADCEAACVADESCLQFRFNPAAPAAADGSGATATAPRCQLQREAADGGQVIGFKVGGGIDYTLYRIPVDLYLGQQLGSVASAASAKDCSALCNGNADCEAFSFVEAAGDCKMLTSELNAAWKGKFHVTGRRLMSDALQSGSP